MASKTFSLGEDGPKGACTKVLLILLMGVVIVAGIIIGIFAFQSAVDGCDSPKMDVNGLSNFSSGAKTIAFGCFPGFFVDQGEANLVISQCIKKEWTPEPPACNFLPLRLDCKVEDRLDGRISMVQMDLNSPTLIFGFVKYKDAIKNEGHINEVIPLSRHSSKCETSQQYNISGEIDEIGEIDEKYMMKVLFESRDLKAYKQADVHFAMIFLDVNTTATLISVHQGNTTLVMPNKVPRFALHSNTNEISSTSKSTTVDTVDTTTATSGRPVTSS